MARLMDVRAAAELVGVTPRTVARWIGSGLLPAQRFGRIFVVDEDDVRRAATERPKPGRPKKHRPAP